MFYWFPFLTYAVVTAVTPGPNNIMAMSAGSRRGFRHAFPFNLGIFCGFFVVMVLCTLACSLLATYLPKVQFFMLLAGAAYMLHLAWATFRSTGLPENNGAHDGFLSGMLLQFVNPKIILYGIMSMEAYILPVYAGQPAALFGFAFVLALIGFVFTLCWCAFGAVFQQLFARHARVLNTVMALLLVYCAVSLFL